VQGNLPLEKASQDKNQNKIRETQTLKLQKRLSFNLQGEGAVGSKREVEYSLNSNREI